MCLVFVGSVDNFGKRYEKKNLRRIFEHCSGQNWTVVFKPNQIPCKDSMSKDDIYGKY